MPYLDGKEKYFSLVGEHSAALSLHNAHALSAGSVSGCVGTEDTVRLKYLIGFM